MTTKRFIGRDRPKVFRSKISRLPPDVRLQINQRIAGHESGTVLLKWLNAHPQVQAVLDAEFDGAPVTFQNLSDWRASGYAEWLAYANQIGSASVLADKLYALADAAFGRLGKGVVAKLAGDMMTYMECPDEQVEIVVDGKKKLIAKPTAEKLELQAKVTTAIMDAEQEEQKIALKERALDIEEGKLALLMQRASETMLALLQEKRAQRIADGKGSNADKIESLGEIMFGDLWTKRKKPDAGR